MRCGGTRAWARSPQRRLSSFSTTLANAPVVSVSMDAHVERALTIAAEIDHPVYDCLYLAVAVHHGIHVMTADRRFAAAALSAYPGQVRLLAAE